MTRQIKRIIAVMMALSLTAAATVTVSAKDTSSMTVDDVVSAFHNSDVQYFNLESMAKYNDYNLEKEKLESWLRTGIPRRKSPTHFRQSSI